MINMDFMWWLLNFNLNVSVLCFFLLMFLMGAIKLYDLMDTKTDKKIGTLRNIVLCIIPVLNIILAFSYLIAGLAIIFSDKFRDNVKNRDR